MKLPFGNSRFSLNASGFAGFFGGDAAVLAMASGTMYIYEGAKWWGWYNCPGSYEIGKRFGQLAKSRFWNGLFPGPDIDPTVLFGLDGTKGPEFMSAFSCTIIPETGHLAHLFTRECKDLYPGVVVEGRQTRPVGVTVAELSHEPDYEEHPKLRTPRSMLVTTIPIAVSIGTCIACGIFGDWYCFSMILLGIVSSGVAHLVIGGGQFSFVHPIPAAGCPDGDGLLDASDEVVILKGKEGAVNSITEGRFCFRFASEPLYNDIAWCSVLLTLQFLAQLLLIPQSTLFGQLMFVVSLAVSWAYNSYLSSVDMEKIQQGLLLNEILGLPKLRKFRLGTRTSAAVFVMLVLRPGKVEQQLDELIPNDTALWRRWKETVARKIRDGSGFDSPVDWDSHWTLEEMKLLDTLYGDARSAFIGYAKYCKDSDVFTHRQDIKEYAT
ncbi:hypothetical protein A0H81_04687 [Grifola frondosa]|uniref:Uncharacterized protein n=1 Tax=Grifola frondosa TaxID=5627 RepID=A0A1C7MED9_GRIFR|nr:hypothetical protein A0H81_04687 [Grifola frondosa]